MPRGIIIFGAMGTGKTTLGRELAQQLKFQHFDLDDYLMRWDTKIPLTEYNTKEERIERLTNGISKYPNFVMSGQMWSIRKTFEPLFDLGIFITAPTEIRVERVRSREISRWGDRIFPGGDMYEVHQESIFFTEQYDTGEPPAVCLKRDEQWVTELPCPVLHIDGTKTIAENVLWLAKQYTALNLLQCNEQRHDL